MSQKQTVLIVDDEIAILNALKRTLRRAGYEVLKANSGFQGLEYLQNHPEIGVVVADFRMPGMNGVEMLKSMCDRSPSVVGLMLSGQADNETVVDAMVEGVVMEFLSKPWSDQELLDNIHHAFQRREQKL